MKIIPLAVSIDPTAAHYLLFTSVNGLRAFMALSRRRDIPVMCVGAKTAELAQDAHFRLLEVAPTAESLLARARTYGPGKTFLYLRARHTAKPVADTLIKSGNIVREHVVYEQVSCDLSKKAKACFQSQNQIILPLFSPRTAAIFQACSDGLDLTRTAAICISPNTAKRLDQARLQSVVVAKQPTANAIAQEIAAII